jgi:hypothetical protein
MTKLLCPDYNYKRETAYLRPSEEILEVCIKCRPCGLSLYQVGNILVEAKTQLGFRYASIFTEFFSFVVLLFLSPTITVGF